MGSTPPPTRGRFRQAARRCADRLAVPLIGFLVLQTSPRLELAHVYLRILIALPVVYFAFRHGWRGAAIGLALSSAAVAYFHVQDDGVTPARSPPRRCCWR